LESEHLDIYCMPATKHAINSHGRGPRRKNKETLDGEDDEDDFYCAATADSLLVEWIVDNAQPYSVVSRLSFKKFCHALNPRHTLPTRKRINVLVIGQWKVTKIEAAELVVKELQG
jgi:hypothetical protein